MLIKAMFMTYANTDTISQHLSTLNNQHETAESETAVSYSKDNQQCAVD